METGLYYVKPFQPPFTLFDIKFLFFIHGMCRKTLKMDKITSVEIDQFLRRYRNQFIGSKRDITMEFKSAYEQLRDNYLQIKQATGIRALTEAPSFNIFRLLAIERAETRTHSVFLADLLNPQGSHGQGELFLSTFMIYCRSKFTDFPLPDQEIGINRWSVHTEMANAYGRMDIVILNPLIGFLCVFENKVDAYEQDHQLERYWQWMDVHRKEYPVQILIYLTPRGGEATTAWGHTYITLSYRQDIATWLEQTIPNIQAARVREMVKQYIEVVERL